MAVNVGTAVAYLDLNLTAFNSGLQQAQSALQTFQNDSSSLGQNLTAAGGVLTNVGSSLTRNITVPIVNAGQEIVKFGSTFDRSMSNVSSVMQPTKAEFEDLRQAAIDWGGKTVYTADEASQALYYMGLAGWDTNKSISALGGVLNLATAGQLELGQTSDIVTDAMTALHLSADGVSEGVSSADWFVNLLAATMSNSNTTVDKLGESFKYVASAVGGLESPMYSAEEASRDTAFMLGILADNGIKGSQAGTTLRRVLLNLENPTDTVKSGLQGLNISLQDVDFTTNGVKGVVDTFRSSVRDLLPYLDEEQISNLAVSDSLSEEESQTQLYNQTMELLRQGVIDTTQQQVLMNIAQVSGAYAVAGLTALIMTEQDEYDNLYDTLLDSNELFVEHEGEIYTIQEAYEKWGDAIYDTSGEFEILGAAEGMAENQMDNLQGSWVKFTNALDTTKIKLNDIVKDTLRKFVDKLTEIVNWFNELDVEQQKNIIKWGLIVAAIGPVLMIFGNLLRSLGFIIDGFKVFQPLIHLVTTIIGQLHAETSILNGVLGLLRGGIEAIFNPMTGWIALIALVIAAVVDLWKNNEDFRNKVLDLWNTLKDFLWRIWEAIKPIFDSLLSILVELFHAIEPIIVQLVDILAPILKAIFEVVAMVVEILSPIINMLLEMLVPALEFLSTILGVVFDILSPLFEVIKVIFELIRKLANVISGTLGKVIQEATKWFSDFFRGIVDGFVQIIHNIEDWFKNLSIVKWFSDKWEGLKSFLHIDGSHKDGLEYVPFNGYLAELHKGERVLTAEENKKYSDGNLGNGGTTIIFNSNEKIDEYTAARELRRVMKDIELDLV